MTRSDDWEELTTGQLLQKARRTCMSVQITLMARVEALGWANADAVRADLDESEAAKASDIADKDRAARQDGLKLLQAEITSLQKSLDSIMDCERKLERIISERAGRRSGDVDLDAARREVLGELARLAERG
ncbi:MAG: hypothetical protein CML46_17485 [Rhodobacteraceae bacterium]|nr:hypothetical protein [Paracoccaceae bacterium]